MTESTIEKSSDVASEEGKATICYFCHVLEPNEDHYDPELHHVCLICGVKLWELARRSIEFDFRGKTVQVRFAHSEAEEDEKLKR